MGEDNSINFSLDVLRTFAEVKVAAPVKVEDLKEAIAKLDEAEADFEERGQSELDKGAAEDVESESKKERKPRGKA